MLTELQRHADNHDSAAARPLLARLHDVLSPLALREEHGVFAELEHAGVAPTYITMFEEDHQQIHALLARTETANWEPATRELVRTLRDHILGRRAISFRPPINCSSQVNGTRSTNSPNTRYDLTRTSWTGSGFLRSRAPATHLCGTSQHRRANQT